jgi:glyoxylase I family protein
MANQSDIRCRPLATGFPGRRQNEVPAHRHDRTSAQPAGVPGRCFNADATAVLAGSRDTRESWRVPGITGQVVILTVSSVVRSAIWYRDLLSMEERGRHVRPDGHVHQVSSFFDEFRAWLDHLEFLVADRGDLDAWAARLDEHGIAHSGIKEPPYTSNAMITFRDPDNIQLEFFWRAPDPSAVN